MRVVYFDVNFESATGQSGPRSYALAKRLIHRGHAVTMLTSDRQFEVPPDAGRIFKTTSQDIPVVAVNMGPASRRLPGRIRYHLQLALTAAWYLLRCERPDVVYVTSPPLSALLPVLLLRLLRGVPFVMEVREVWPEVPQAMNLIRSRTLLFSMRRLALAGYRAASQVVALTEPAVHHIQADIPLSPKVSRIGPCCDLELFARADGSNIRARQGWGGKFVCLHVGPMIPATGLEAILRVADVLREDEQFVFWLVGGGEDRPKLERNIRDRELHNVIIWDDVPRDRLPEVIAAADLCLMTVRHFKVLEQASSDRLFDCLAAGKPLLLNYGGWQRDLIERHQAGMGTVLGDYGRFFEYICRLCDQPELRAEMGRNARRLAETICNPDSWAEKLEQVLLQAAAGKSTEQAQQAGT